MVKEIFLPGSEKTAVQNFYGRLKMAPCFQRFLSKTYDMPNSANRSEGGNNASKGRPKHDQGRGGSPGPGPERSDVKHGTDEPKHHRGDTGRSSGQGRKEASGGSAED